MSVKTPRNWSDPYERAEGIQQINAAAVVDAIERPLRDLLRRWRDAALDGDAATLGELTAETTKILDS